MNWGQQLENCAVYFGLPLVFYVLIGPFFRSLHPAGTLSWQGRRFRKGVTLVLLLLSSWLEVSELRYRVHVISAFVAMVLYGGLGMLFLFVIRWWWQDRQKEKAGREALVAKLHEEDRELVAPPMSTGKKAWRWVVNGYAIFLVAAGLYALVHYLLKRFF
jgi:hypothetical protein